MKLNMLKRMKRRSGSFAGLLMLQMLISISVASHASADNYPRNPNVDVLNYSFRLTLNDENNLLAGEMTATIRFLTAGISTFHLDLIGKSGEENREGGAGTGMTVESLEEDGKSIPFNHENNRILIRMDSPSRAKERRIYKITYSGIPADGLIIAQNKYGERTFFGDNWPDRARHWLPTVDHPSDKASCEFIIIAPDHYQVIANGALVEETDLAGGRRRTHWRENAPLATKLMVIGAARFAVQYLEEYEGISLQTWVYPQDLEGGFASFAVARRILDFYDSHIGTFSYPKLANVQSKTRYGGMENASCIFYSEGRPNSARWSEGLIAHEMAHQWFGDSVSEGDWHHIWLSEGFATYFTEVYMEFTYGRDRFVEGMKSSRERVLRYYQRNPTSPVVDTTITNLNRLLSTNSYQKGAWVLHMLRHILGDEVWWTGIREFYSRYRNGNALSEDFQEVMEEISGRDLAWFFRQWLYQPGQPKYSGSWYYNASEKQLTVTLNQVQDNGTLFQMPVDLGIYVGEGRNPRIEVLEVKEERNTFTFQLDDEPHSIILDPNTWMLMEVEFTRK